MVALSELNEVISLKILETVGILNKKYVDVRIPDLEVNGIYSGRVNLNDSESVQFILKQRGDLSLCTFWFSDTSNIIQKPSSWFCIAAVIHIDDDNNVYCETSNISFCHLNVNNDNKPYFISPSDYELADIWRSFEIIKLITPYWVKNEPTKQDIDIFLDFTSKVKLEDDNNEEENDNK